MTIKYRNTIVVINNLTLFFLHLPLYLMLQSDIGMYYIIDGKIGLL